MKYAYFPGCKIPFYQEQYGTATRAVLARQHRALRKLRDLMGGDDDER